MNQKYVMKKKLIAINQKALRAKANAIEPDYLASISGDLKYTVDRAMPFPERNGWVRCFVGIASTPTGDGFRSLLLDFPEKDFERLPTVVV